ncbi:endonuclease/exonuclease/phosphatase family protein [Ensifer sp. 2YAB10]|uniref:endonuclease/exonuclease/phosphatase family protein n=1 Tax=Ensifer TaxID=106591 RepID=UPI001CBE8D27|nr:endonuclease/exonuclease/phosphatase family protein [Ensifer adhaerens]MBZ7922176.1 endonuclease [Ensifer adhaerens]UAX90827.1 endonuclease [Ensifer adhaerens]UAX98456.1 endonuclease [Ensifer adhaerens]UAY05837.1 endonuclease [Ensifer adhaerens]
MSLRLATFNIENLLSRFDFSGFRNQLKQDRVLRLFDVKSEAEYQRLEEARTIAHTDDTRQMSALAIADCDADILCLQEADNMASLQAFEYNYLFRMVGSGYRQKYLIEGNDSRGIDVAVLMREETRDGQPIECLDVKSHAGLTYEDLDLFNDQIALTNRPADRIFKRDCLELDLRIGGRPLTLYVVHFKSMGPAREGLDGRQATMPLRVAEASAVRHIIESRFGRGRTADKMFAICGDMNDYQEKVNILGDRRNGYQFVPHEEDTSSLDVFSHDGFAENPMLRRPVMDRWTLFHSRGPQERHLCQLDYIWLSPALAKRNHSQVPEVIRGGQPFRTIFPPGLEVERYPRTGWDRPKASDHCPVAITLDV